jgi:hypothetical protein
MGIMMIPLVGFLALGFEVSNWYMITRSMQNAADAATLAAAINNSANYDVEARAVAAQYGFTNGVNNVTIGVSNTATCPSTGTKNCYSVTVSGYTPLLMSQIVGFQGAGNINGQLQKQLSALAVAQPSQKDQPLCLLALANSHTNPALNTNGAPSADMHGCSSMSNTGASCSGHNLGLDFSFAAGSNPNCGNQQIHNDPIPDPYRTQITNNIGALPANPCGSYPQETHQGNHYTVAASNQHTGTWNLTAGNNFFCGDQQIVNGPVNITVNGGNGGNAVMIIENGQLDLNGNVLQMADNKSFLTIVFTGSDCCGYLHAPTDNTNGPGGVLDIRAPTSGPWSGFAIVQDPALRTGLDVAAAGNSPAWKITGVIYMPYATINLKGAIDKSTYGGQCVVMIADNFQISGTGGIAQTDVGPCGASGVTNQPTAKIPGAAKLVL